MTGGFFILSQNIYRKLNLGLRCVVKIKFLPCDRIHECQSKPIASPGSVGLIFQLENRRHFLMKNSNINKAADTVIKNT